MMARGQGAFLILLLLAIVTLVFFAGADGALKAGIDFVLPSADTMSYGLWLLVPALFLVGALFWAISFLPGVLSR